MFRYLSYIVSFLFYQVSNLNEQVAYKRGWPGHKKKATGIKYCQNGRLAKAKVTICVLDTCS